MTQRRTCPDCGSTLPDDAPRGLCPQCLMGAAISAAPERGDAPTVGLSVLDTIARTVGLVPRILLRDTAPGESPSPIVRPGGGVDGPIRYRIDGEIARGGMGVVLKGRDPDLGRDVAIKVLRDEMRSNPDVVRRFVEEAQIGGQLQHPGIVPIYELGTFSDQRPFFSMKMVKGHTLAAILAARGRAGEDRPRLLGVFESIAQTVAYAHARGVIHRDLKPSNVMVGSFGEVQVMDWGLAKVLARGGVVDDETAGRVKGDTVIATARSGSDVDLSQAGSVLGTPSYMSPEQARGEVEVLDERCDVFALGSILCEILTGEPAFTGRSAGEIVRKAARGDTAPALGRLHACEADAELIALAEDCLATEVEDRPRDASAVAARITAHLASVQDRLHRSERDRAVAESRALEERRRRRLQVGLAASVLALAGLGLGGSTWIERQRAGRAAAAEAGIADALAEAQRLRGEAQAAEEPDAASSRWTAALTALKHAADLARQGDAGAEMRGRIEALAASLERGKREADDRGARLKADRTLLSTLETTRGGFAEHEDPGRTDAEYADAFRLAGLDVDAIDAKAAGKWLAARSSPAELVSYLDDWADRRRATGRPEPDWRRLVSVARAADPDTWRDTLRARFGATDDASLAELRRLAADANALDAQPIGSLVLLARQLGLTLNDRQLAAEVLRRGLRRFPDDFWAHAELALTGVTYVGVTRADEAIRHLTTAVALRPRSMFARGRLGWFYAMIGRFDEAVAVHQEQIRLRPDVASGYMGLGVVRCRQSKAWEAAELLRKAVELDPMNGVARTELGVALSWLGKPAEAAAAFREGIRLNPRQPWQSTEVIRGLADSGQTDRAIAAARSLIRLSPDYESAHMMLIDLFARAGKLEEITREYRESVRVHPAEPTLRLALAHALTRAGKVDPAIGQLEQAILLQPENPSAHASLGSLFVAKKRLYEAELRYREAVRLQPDNQPNCVELSALLASRGKIDEAITVARDTQRYWDRLPGRNALGAALARLDANDESVAKLRAWIKLDPLMMPFRARLVTILRVLKRDDEANDLVRESVRMEDGQTFRNALSTGLLLDLKGSAEDEATYREAIRNDRTNFEALWKLAQVVRGQGKIDEAIALFREAAAVSPRNSEPHSQIGRMLVGRNRHDEAIEAHREAIRRSPEYPGLQTHLGIALRAAGRLDEAIPALRDGVRLAPDALWVNAELTSALVEARRFDEAEASSRNDFRINPAETIRALGRYAAGLTAARKLDDAIALYRILLRRTPDDADARIYLGVALRDKGDVAAGEAEFKAVEARFRGAIRLKPDDASLRVDLGKALFQAGAIPEAEAEFREALKLKPDDSIRRIVEFGGNLRDGGRVDDAIAALRMAIRLKPDDRAAHFDLVHVFTSVKRDPSAAEAAARDGVRSLPDDAACHERLASTLMMSLKYDEAERAYREAIRLDPDLPDAHCNLGVLLTKVGRYKEAVAELRIGQELASRLPRWDHPTATWLADAERALALSERIPAILKGDDRLTSTADRLTVGSMLYDTKRFASAARLFREAIEADPKAGDDRRVQSRYNAACAAALADAGRGRDEPMPTPRDRDGFRKLALTWLRAELDAWEAYRQAGGAPRRRVLVFTLEHWKKDTDLSSIRAPDALARLSEPERKDWQALWGDVDAMLRLVRAMPSTP